MDKDRPAETSKTGVKTPVSSQQTAPGGYTGKILRVNLSDGCINVERHDEIFYRRYLGGSGFIAYFLLKEVGPGTDPLGKDNKLIFALGPLTGTTIVGSSRNAVGAQSPLSGGIALSQVGETWGAELKWAGFDAIIVEGKADKPVYLWIKDGKVSIKEAGHLWGKKTGETQLIIRQELGDDKIRVAQIGPGGENLVKFACIMNGCYDAAGRGGLGAVMGSKNLKAIAVRGHQKPRLADPARLKILNKGLIDHLYDNAISVIIHEFGTGGPELEQNEKIGDMPVRNWQEGLFPNIKQIHGVAIRDTIRTGMDGCFACPIRCKKKVEVKEPYNVDPTYGGPEYETLSSLGSNCVIDNLKAIARGNELCNAYSLDTISTGGVIAFAMECFEKGLIGLGETDGIELKFGNAEAMLQCIELIARRKGFGVQLAEGTAWLSKRIGHGSNDFAMQVKGIEAGQHEPRLMPSMGLGFMVNPHGADHCSPPHDNGYTSELGMRRLKSIGYLDELDTYDVGPRKVALFKTGHQKQILIDCLLMCHLTTLSTSVADIAAITAAVTGWNTSATEQERAAERVLTMSRLFNTRQGLTAEDDKLPLRFFQPKTNGALSKIALDPAKMEKAKKYYYNLMGWDNNGVPLPEKLMELEIDPSIIEI
jgi:aldehyde:ferredoxin oxidoreductase